MSRFAIIKHEVVEFCASQEEAEKRVKELMDAKEVPTDIGTYYEAVSADRRCRTCVYKPGGIYTAASDARAVCVNPGWCYHVDQLTEVDRERECLGMCRWYEPEPKEVDE